MPEGLTIERINNDGDYEPSNCRWATRQEQAQNKTNGIALVKPITFNGITLSRNGWSAKIGARCLDLVSKRITLLGWSEEKAVSTPVQKYTKRFPADTQGASHHASGSPSLLCPLSEEGQDGVIS